MVKTLLNKIGKIAERVKRAVPIAVAAGSIAFASLGLAGCTPTSDPRPKPEPGYDIILPNVNVTQGESKTVNLSDLAQDSGVTWTGVAEYDSNLLTPSLSGDKLTVEVSNDISEDVPYSVKLKAVNDGKEEAVKLEGIVKNIVEVSGVLQSNETGTNHAGIVKLFDSAGSKAGECSTSDGNFKITSDFSAGNMKLQARLNDGYVRTMNIPLAGKDVSGVLLRAVPHVNFDIDDSGSVDENDNQKFIDWMKQINTLYSYEDGTWFSKITKWNLNNLTAIEICRTNSEKGISFSQTAIDNLLGYLADSENIPKLISGKKNLSSIVQVLDSSSEAHKLQAGYITVIPDDWIGTKGGIGLEENACDYLNTCLTTASLIHVIPENELRVSKHEFGHSFIAPALINESEHVISPKNTIMYSGVEHPSKPGLADEKAGKLLYEESYSAGERIENILGTSFIDNSD
jgi:hypothetical protein